MLAIKKLPILIPAALLTSALILSACKKQIGPEVSQTILEKVTEADFGHITDSNLKKHLVNQFNKTEFRTKTLSSGKGTTDTTEYKFTGKNASYSTVSNDGKKDISDLIQIGDTTYLKDFKDGKWWKQKAKPSKETEQKIEENNPETGGKKEAEESKKETFKFLGKEPCGTLTCFKYQQLTGDTLDRTFWFDDKEFLLRKEEISSGEFKTAIEYSYDNIKISAPSPTKDVPEGKNIYEYYNFGGESPDTSAPTTNTQDLMKLYQQQAPTDQSGRE